jgi:hypothetical protein
MEESTQQATIIHHWHNSSSNVKVWWPDTWVGMGKLDMHLEYWGDLLEDCHLED